MTILKISKILCVSDYMNFSTLELYLAVGSGEECIVSAHTDIAAGEKFRSALSY
jgi:hypothetical protein